MIISEYLFKIFVGLFLYLFRGFLEFLDLMRVSYRVSFFLEASGKSWSFDLSLFFLSSANFAEKLED